MIPRPSPETLESLRLSLQRLEQSSDTASGSELKQMLLNQIAELETLNALSPPRPELIPAPAPSDLPPLAVVAEEESSKQALETLPLEKLD